MKLTLSDRAKIFMYNLNSPDGKIRPEVINLYLRLKNKPEEFSVFSKHILFDSKTKILYSAEFHYVYCQTFHGAIEEKIKNKDVDTADWTNLFEFNYAEGCILSAEIDKLIKNHYNIINSHNKTKCYSAFAKLNCED